METTTFFSIEPFNSVPYWEKRVSEFSLQKGTSKRERDSFYLEFFISAYLDNKSKIARKLGVPFTEVVFDNPNAPIMEKIVQQYNFYDEKELKRVAEGFYHYFRIFQFWNEYWTINYDTLRKDVDKRFLTRCALTFLTLSYPASYTSYMERNAQSTFFLYDDRVKGLGFSSIAKLLECSLLFCQPGTKLAFPWDPRHQDESTFIWNEAEKKDYFEDFKEVLGNFLHSGYSMRHEDYSLLTKIRSGVLPLQYSWRRNSTNETLQDKQTINRLIVEYSKKPIQPTFLVRVDVNQSPAFEDDSTSIDSLELDSKDAYSEQIVILLETVFIMEELLLNKALTNDDKNDRIEELNTELKTILETVTNLDGDVPFEFLKLATTHLERLYVQLQGIVALREKEKASTPSASEIFNDVNVLTAFEEEKRTHALFVHLQQSPAPEPLEKQNSKYSLLKDQHLKQTLLLSNALEQNRKLRDQLQESISINSTKKALSKYFSAESLDRLIEYLKKNG
ncbi:hypothetical protein [Sphaerochaeta globosa]|uniref:Uncharacterized protein n=1 Tax=Sphaerochaeta globosa (strain ATCC BAA-1886 / DSM 22777 / Buddy) TaxID=158189 RepID=F0RTE6_SPHGB|nr:hypothetical protein [Sphaerochaeta globosa]ADY14428.1 hypothetical protein SpiBuddy_2617 [Sphaerochaeta globosa str. Buddy]